MGVDVAVQWEPQVEVRREVGVQCVPETLETGVQVDLTQTLSGPSMLLQCVSVRADGPEGGALLQHCSRPRPRGRPRLTPDQTRTKPGLSPDQTRTKPGLSPDQTRTKPGLSLDQTRTKPGLQEDQTRTKTRTRTREIRPSRRYQDYETSESPDRKRRRAGVVPGAEEEEPRRTVEEEQSAVTGAEEEETSNKTLDPTWTPRGPHRVSQNSISHDASVKPEPGGVVSVGGGGVVCDVCGKVLKTKSSLSRHALVHSGSKPFSCPYCPISFNRKDNLRHHLSHLHPHGPAPRHKPRPLRTWLCHTCGKTFSCQSRLRTHEVIHSGVKPCKCPLCPKAYMRMNDLEHHLKTVHPNGSSSAPPPPPLLCHLCGRSFRCRSLLTLHLQQHSGERPHLCHLCGRKFSRKYQLRAHSATVHRDRELQLTQEYSATTDNQTELQLAEDDGPKVETDEYMENGNGLVFVCEVCGRRMKTAAILEAHRSVHSGDKPFLCGLCGRGFQRQTTLKQHQGRVHLRVKPLCVSSAPCRPCSFPCSVCGRSFKFRSLLLAHAQTHSDLRPFTCDLCPRSFRRRSHLQRHLQAVHPDGLPLRTYVCSVCGVDQKYRSRLQRHLLVHSGERPYSCDRCGLSFGRLGNLHQHQRRIHGDRIQMRRRGNDYDDGPDVCLFGSDLEQEWNTYDTDQTGSEVLQTGSEALQTGSEVLEAGSEVLQTGSEVLEAGSEALHIGSEALQMESGALETGSEAVHTGSDFVDINMVVPADSLVVETESEIIQIEVSSSECS